MSVFVCLCVLVWKAQLVGTSRSLHSFVLVLIFINERNQVDMRDTCNTIRWSDKKNNIASDGGDGEWRNIDTVFGRLAQAGAVCNGHAIIFNTYELRASELQ